jgi:glutathione synthase/RimK-type ligase-like ATP-grasp enzyme
MDTLIVVSNPASWPFDTPGVELVKAWDFLTNSAYFDRRGCKVFNLCRSYAYQSQGYYVSLLAEARGQRCLPTVATIQDLKSTSIIRVASEDLDKLIQKSLHHLKSDQFELSIYFGRNLAHTYDALAQRIFNLYPAPLLRAYFSRKERWQLRNINLLSGNDVPDSHRDFVATVANDWFARRRMPGRKAGTSRFDLAILHDPNEAEPPSDARALERFAKAARAVNVSTELIRKEDYGRIGEFDGLFIRETTRVNHHTYRFARRAYSEGLVVIDDPESILRCTNKVFLAELLAQKGIATPRTVILHEQNVEEVGRELGFPVILKRPDSAASQGVVKVADADELVAQAREFLEDSDLLIAQEFIPTPFDWRIGIVDGVPLYACKYHMAHHHWQIINWTGSGSRRYGRVETLPVEIAPRRVVRTALRAAKLIGDGLYGVDLKDVEGKCQVIEVNDNPTIESGCEDRVLGDQLYDAIVGVFVRRMESRRQRRTPW